MKKLFLIMCALATGIIVNAQARVYAYDLKLVDNGDSYTVEFKTNTAAAEACVIVYDPENSTESFTITATSSDDTNWSAEIASSAVNPETNYNFKVKATADDVTEFTYLTEVSDTYKFYRSYAVAVDNTPSSPYFGTVYVANSYVDPAKADSYDPVGLYTYTPQLNADGKQHHEVECIGETSSGTRPRDMAIASDGRIFTTDYSATTPGVYCIDPSDFSCEQVFQGELKTVTDGSETPVTSYAWKNGDTYVGGRAGGLGVRGEGENVQLFVCDNAKSTDEGMVGSNLYDYICRYDIGTSNTWSSAPSWSANKFANKEGKTSSLPRGYNSIDPVTNGFWVALQRSQNQSNTTYPSLFYYSEKTGYKEFEIVTDMPNLEHTNSTKSGGLAVNEDLGLIAYTMSYPNSSGTSERIAYVRVLSYTEGETGTVSVTHIGDYNVSDMGQGRYSNELAFDYAGNLYAVSSNKEYLSVFALPTVEGGNVRETPGQGTLLFTANGTTTAISNVAIDSNAPVEYYNLQGVKVENPSNGVFIKKQGGKAVKVVL